MHDNILDSAYSYLNFDLPIIPLCSYNHRGCSDKHKGRCKSPGKAPVLKNWSEHKHTTEEHLEEWFGYNKYSNLGLVLGQTENWNIVGVDIDGDLGEQTFQAITQTEDVPDTWEFTSGNGRRLLYLLPDGMMTKKNKVAWAEGHEELAFIAQGQQTVIPPSIHPSGRTYQWKEGHSPFDSDIAMAPQWLIEKVQVKETVETLPWVAAGEQLSVPVVVDEMQQQITAGGRSDHMTRFVGSLCAKRNIPKATILQTALMQNRQFCSPPLTDAEIEAMVESIYASEMHKHQATLARQRRRQELHPMALAELFEANLNNAGTFWMYNQSKGKMYSTTSQQGPWIMLEDEVAQAEIATFIASQDASMATTAKIIEVYKQMVLRSINNNGDGNDLNLGDNPYSDKIALMNGVFDWKNQTLEPWSPKFKHTTLIEATWEDNAKESGAWSMWQEALRSWIPDEKTIMFLQEYIGYALLPSCKMRTAVFLHGEGANGKSLFIDVVNLLFAKSSMVTNPTALGSRFGSSCIIDKLLVVCSDIDSTYLDKTGTLKQIIAGDRVRAEYKGGKEFDFVPVCKLLFSANKLPKSADKTHGWYSRLQLVHFPRQFKPDMEYYSKLMAVMGSPEGRSALLMWAVEGLQRLTAQGEWTVSNDMIKAKAEYKRDNDNVLSFAYECLEASPVADGSYKTSLVLKAVYQTYKEWCMDAGMKQASQQEFTQRISSVYPKKSMRWKTGKGWKTMMSLVDVRWREDLEFDAQESYDTHIAFIR